MVTAFAKPSGLRAIAEALITINQQMDRIALLEANWDGHGAVAIDPRLLRTVRSWSLQLPGWALFGSPSVVPLSTGALQLEWHNGTRVLELEFEGPDRIHFLQWDSTVANSSEGSCDFAEAERILHLIEWIQQEPSDA